MKRQDKKVNCLSRNRRSQGRRRHDGSERGFIFLIVMIVAIFLLIALAAAAPSVYTEGQREKEKELIFRGEQYAVAIFHFDQQFHRYPMNVKELLYTNNLSFLRRPWPDPMTKDGKWRFIHCTATGVVTDSETIGLPGQKPGQSANPFGSSSESNGSNFPGSLGQTESGSSGAFGKVEGAFICGVASTSGQASIMEFNHHSHYNHWEFIGVPGVPGSVISAPQAAPGQPMGAPSVPATGTGFGNGMTGAPASNPFGP